MPEFVTSLPTACTLGEGPVWDERLGALWLTDIEQAVLLRIDWGSRQVDRFALPDRLGSLGLTDDPGRIICAFARGFATYWPDTGRCDWLWRIPEDVRGIRMNDGRVDRQGRFIAGSMVEDASLAPPEKGSLWRLSDQDPPALEQLLDGITISNSICFSPDGTTMYFTDTPTRRIGRYAVGGGSARENGILAAVGGAGFPDGSDVDSAGRVWNAEWGSGRVTAYDPDGTVVDRVELPVTQATCVAFGGPSLDLMFVTTARQGLAPTVLADQPQAGDIFVYRIDVPGLPSPRYGARP